MLAADAHTLAGWRREVIGQVLGYIWWLGGFQAGFKCIESPKEKRDQSVQPGGIFQPLQECLAATRPDQSLKDSQFLYSNAETSFFHRPLI